MKIPLASSDYRRRVGAQPDVLMRNRFVEQNPVLQEEPTLAFMQRPALKRWVSVGTGPVRTIYHQAGAFSDDLFVAAYDTLYRVDDAGTSTAISTNLASPTLGTPISFACTGPIGTIPPRLFFADGQTLRFYTTDGPAHQTLTGTAIANNDTVTIDGVYYKFTSGSVDTGTPAGTAGSPWLVKLGASFIASCDYLFAAINDSGTPGTDYSTACAAHATVTAASNTASGLIVRAITTGALGNAIAVSETGANMAWGGATLTGGGSATVTQVATPDDVGIISLAFISGYVIAVPAQGDLLNGRFYWINPGETTIDPIDYATAERSADPVYQAVVFGDQFWLPGQNSTEVWAPTGDVSAPMLRQQGILFDRGTYPGTAIQVKDSMVIVDLDGGVFQVKGGDQRVSTPDIEERIRKGFAVKALYDSLH